MGELFKGGVSPEMLLSKGMSIGLIVLFFGLIVFFLRYLYGPKGRLRDPQWDVWNEETRLASARQTAEKTLETLRRPFLRYARSHFTGRPEVDAHLQLKIDHTMRVVAHARLLIEREAPFAEEETARALLLAALYHDVGRFPQFARYQTYSDDISCNHGTLGAKAIRRENFWQDENPRVRRLALTAVAAHNRAQVPEAVRPPLRDVLFGVRDADKLDILRIMAAQLGPGIAGDSTILLHLSDEPERISPVVLAAAQQGETALYRDMRYYNDMRLLLCTWLNDFRFAASLAAVRAEGVLEPIVAGLAPLPGVQRLAREIVDRLGHAHTVRRQGT